jgi:hypothetical protein
MKSYRSRLIRVLSEIDGLLIEAECAVEGVAGDDRASVLDILIEFQAIQRFVETELAET